MNIAADETKVGEYYFKNPGDVANMSVLTNRRLIVVYGNAEENYPLSKITAVKVIFNRSFGVLILGALLLLPGLGLLTDAPLAALVSLASGAGLIYLGWKGKTRLLISQMGGAKHYVVRGRSPKLTEFLDAVNGKLS